MSGRLPPLNGLRAFEAAARHGSFVGAAAELGVTPAAVSQQVKGLEQYLDRELFRRLNNGLSLTDAGRAAYPAVAEGFERFAQAAGMLREERPEVRLTVSALPSVAVKWLAPRLARYLVDDPTLRVALRVEEDPIEFARDDVDLRLAYGAHHYPGLVVEELVTDCVLPLCRPDEAARIAGPAALVEHALVHTDWGPAYATHPTWASWFHAAGVEARPEAARGHRVTMSSLAIDLAGAGAGVALGQELLARDDLAAGRLASPFGPVLPLAAPYCLVYPHAKAGRPALEALAAWVHDEAGRAARALTPRGERPRG